MNVPFLDLKAQMASIRADVDREVGKVFDACSFILGPQVAEFEQAFARFCGTDHAIGVGSGLEALSMALQGLGIGPGDEVIVPANSFVASALAVTKVGATAVTVDSKEDDFQIDATLIEAAITPATKAIMPVHLYGRLVEMAPIMALAEKHGLFVIEDAAQAHGAEREDGRRAGSIGHVGCFSFFPGKNLGAYGDGGAVTTNDAALADKIRKLRNYGSSVKYKHELLGGNSRLDSVQAAVLGVKLRHMDAWNQARRERAEWLDAALADADVVRPPLHRGKEHVWHLYVIRSTRRDALLDHLMENGVVAGIHYPLPIHLQECYKDARGMGAPGSHPVSESQGGELLTLPIFPELTREQVDYMAGLVTRFS